MSTPPKNQPDKTVEGFSRSWYEGHKVAPPEHIPYLTDEELEAKFAEIKAKTHHEWRQRGTYLFCIGCPYEHGDYIPPEYMLQGTDEKGLPELTKVG
jgi:hypothetical protein